jgi:hypothetical protein
VFGGEWTLVRALASDCRSGGAVVVLSDEHETMGSLGNYYDFHCPSKFLLGFLQICCRRAIGKQIMVIAQLCTSEVDPFIPHVI